MLSAMFVGLLVGIVSTLVLMYAYFRLRKQHAFIVVLATVVVMGMPRYLFHGYHDAAYCIALVVSALIVGTAMFLSGVGQCHCSDNKRRTRSRI